MSEMSELTGKNLTDTPATGKPGPGNMDLSAIERATGVKINPEDINDGSNKKADVDISPVSTPKRGGMSFIGAEEAEQMGLTGKEEKLDVEKMAAEESEKKYRDSINQEMADMSAMFRDVLAEEEDRIQRMENTINDEEKAKELLPPEQQKQARIEREAITTESRMKNERMSNNPAITDEDLVPSYSDDDKEETPEAEEHIPNPGDDEYGDYIRSLDVVQAEPSPYEVVNIIKDPAISIVPSGRAKREQSLGDQAFMNAVSKFKKEHFSKAHVPLVNSGFYCDIVGTGVVDLQQLYMNVDQNTSVQDYTLEQMRTVIRNVVGTSPKVPSTSLHSMIHADDFDMMAYGHICATLRQVETVTNCTECGKPFHITDQPENLLLNAKELSERAAQIENAPNIEAYSLMTHYHTVDTKNGIIVSLGHPSYSEKVRSIQGFQNAIKSMTPADQHRFASMLDTLLMVRKIKLPSGVYSNSIYQHFMAVTLLGQDDMDTITHEIEAMRKQILHPKFGVREVVCPYCGNKNKDIVYENLLEMLFYHTTISSFLNSPEG